MKLSSKGRYAIQAMFDLAFHGEGSALQVKEISLRQQIPPRFLEQVFQDLRKAGLVRSKRGPRGGYQLASPPAQIRLGDIIRAAQGPLAWVLEDDEASKHKTTGVAIMQHVLRELGERIDKCLDSVTLADMCQEAHDRGLSQIPSTPYVYSI